MRYRRCIRYIRYMKSYKNMIQQDFESGNNKENEEKNIQDSIVFVKTG